MKIPKIIIYVYIAYILVAVKSYFVINEIFHYDKATLNIKLIIFLSIPLVYSSVMNLKRFLQEKSNNKIIIQALKDFKQ